jgi:hypothetical protein
MRDGDGGSRKRFLFDSLLKHGKGAAELFVLVREVVREQAVVSLVQRNPQVAFVIGL